MMKYCRICEKLSFSQSGFTLIELIVGIFLSAVIFGGITATLLQIFHITESNNAHLLAVAQYRTLSIALIRISNLPKVCLLMVIIVFL